MKFIKRALQFCLLSLTLCTIGLFTAATAPAATYYIDASSGSNSNAGTSKGAPWKSHPYMQTGSGCTGGTTGWGGYVHAAGDQFIFKGGVTWPAACFGLVVPSGKGGSVSAQDYYGVDVTWFNGGSFTQPKWDLAQNTAAGDIVFSAGTATGADYVTLDDIEIANQNVTPNHNNFLLGTAIDMGAISGSTTAVNSIVSRVYIHDWMSTTPFVPGTSGNMNGQAALGGIDGATIVDSTIISDQNGFATYNGTVYHEPFGGGTVFVREVKNNSHFSYGWFGCVYSTLSVHDSEFDHLNSNDLSYLGSNYIHPHIIFDNAVGGSGPTFALYNNKIHDNNNALIVKLLYDNSIYNNVMWNNTGNVPIRLVSPCRDGSANCDNAGNIGYIFNNTVVGSGPVFQIDGDDRHTVPALGTINLENNLWITDNSSAYGTMNANNVNFGTPVNDFKMGSSEAAQYGFTSLSTPPYHPTSSDPNVTAKGANLTSFCSGVRTSLCQDASGAARPNSAWDLGCYQGSGGSAGGPPLAVLTSPTCGTNCTGIQTLTATCTPQGTATIANAQFYIDGFAFGTLDTSPPFTTTWNTVTASNARAHTVSVVCTDSQTLQGSASVSATPTNNHPHGAYVSDQCGFTGNSCTQAVPNIPFPAQTGSFLYSVCMTPYTTTGDNEVGLSQNIPVSYADFAVIIAIRAGSHIQVYNGSNATYTTDAGPNAYPALANTIYCFQIAVNMASKNFVVNETVPNTITIAGGVTPYGFRNTSTTSLGYISAYATTDSTPDTLEVSSFPPPPTNLRIINSQ